MTKNLIKKAREQKGISQLELSYMTKIAPSNISAIEAGKLHLYSGWKQRIAKALNVSEDEIQPIERGEI